MQEKKHILVTGNGFDLYHGLKTNYSDFINTVSEILAKKPDDRTEQDKRFVSLCQNNGFFKYFQNTSLREKTWTEFESELTKIINVFIRFPDTIYNLKKEDAQFDMIRYSICYEGFSFYELTVFKRFFNLFEQIYDDMSGGLFKMRPAFITDGRDLDEKAMIRELRKELDDFTAALRLYLIDFADISHCTARADFVKAIKPDYVVTFNYTNTHSLYGVAPEQVFFAKGSVLSDPSNMVLGVPDDSEDHLDFIYFKNYFQSIVKFTGSLDKKYLYPADDQGNPISVITHFFGYSFAPGDESIIRTLDDASEKFIIYYTDSEDYARKVIQLIKLFGKDAALEKIQTEMIIFKELTSF